MNLNNMNMSSSLFSKISLTIQERRWLLLGLDLATVNSGLLIALKLRSDYELDWLLIRENLIWFVLLSGLWLIFGQIFQVYDLKISGEFWTAIGAVVGAGLTANLVFNFIPYLPPALPPSRQPFFFALFVPVGLIVLGRIIYLLFFSSPDFRRKVVIVGAGWAGRTIHQALAEHGRSVYELVGYVDDDPSLVGKKIRVKDQEFPTDDVDQFCLPLLGGTNQLENIIPEHDLDVVVIAITHGVNAELLKVFTDILQQRVDVVPMPVLYETLMGRVPVEHIGVHWAASIPLEHPSNKAVWKVTKRIFDLFWAGLGMLFLLPVFPVVALVIYLDSPGPIIYRQERLGRNGKEYQMYKFRSMVIDAEQDGAVWADEDDPRITRFGKFLRKTHLDEFPQFFNIIKGDMSVVGPRPERPEFVEKLTEEIPFYRVRLAVKPGMAGWGLIHQGYGSSVEDSLRKLEFDLYYIKHQNLALDFQILFRTFWETVTMRGF